MLQSCRFCMEQKTACRVSAFLRIDISTQAGLEHGSLLLCWVYRVLSVIPEEEACQLPRSVRRFKDNSIVFKGVPYGSGCSTVRYTVEWSV